MKCPSCNGTGKNSDEYETTCDLCGGWGKVKYQGRTWEKCYSCKGSGKGEEQYEKRRTGIHIEYGTRSCKCWTCNGKGGWYKEGYTPDSGHDKGCFITTATCLSLKKGDTCSELNTFRQYRDSWLKENYLHQVAEYYEIAPRIVEKIDKENNAHEIYRGIWEDHLAPCLELIANEEYEATRIRYQTMVEILKRKFIK